jgi:SAM-dependent methyltransferase
MTNLNRKKTAFYGDDLAYLHNRYYSGFLKTHAPRAIRMLRQAGIRRGVVCDLGCGGGQLSSALLEAGYEPIGIDRSRAMVKLARQQVKGARFLHGSMTEMKLPGCRAALALNEVMNYLPSRQLMARAFRNIFRALEPGGIFIFDIIGPLAEKLSRVGAHVAADWAVIVHIEQDPSTRKLVRYINSFLKAGRYYRRTFEIHRLAVFPRAKVEEMLRAAGFQVRSYSGYAGKRLGQGRSVLVARKPAR